MSIPYPSHSVMLSHPQLLALSPAQKGALEQIEVELQRWPLVGLAALRGTGRSTVLREVARRQGGVMLDLAALTSDVARRAVEETDIAIAEHVLALLANTDLLIIDDIQALQIGTLNLRPSFFSRVVLPHLAEQVCSSGKRMLISAPATLQSPMVMQSLFGQGYASVSIPSFGAADYACFAANIAGNGPAAAVDFDIVFRWAGGLNGHQLRMACGLMTQHAQPSAESFIQDLQRYGIVAANTRTQEVESLDLRALPGHEAIAEELERHVVLPLEHRTLAKELNLRPKRGVLLYGPPGTGKTSVGRALAHRMQGKFFLIDGSFVSEPPGQFFGHLSRVIEEAKANSPSVLFIDDADVLFGIEHITGLTRYLLTLLDGLESQTASHVCVMMTAMDASRIPDALLRSGRVELWLETRLPDAPTRQRILAHWTDQGLAETGKVDLAAIAARTDGFTPADLRRLVTDAKALMAIDRVRLQPLREALGYLHTAVDQLLRIRQQLEGVLGRDDHQPSTGGRYAQGIGGLAESGSCGVEAGW